MNQSSIKQATLVVTMAASLILIWFLEISLSGTKLSSNFLAPIKNLINIILTVLLHCSPRVIELCMALAALAVKSTL